MQKEANTGCKPIYKPRWKRRAKRKSKLHTREAPIFTMAPLEVFIFGDQTVAFEPTLHRLLHVKDDVLLTDFFDRVGFQLRRHVSSLPAHQKTWFPLFTTLLDLFAEHERAYAAPALKFALLCATEIGQFIRYSTIAAPALLDFFPSDTL